MTNSANRKGTMFTLDEEVIELLNKAKGVTHVPKSQIVELALEEYLKDYKSDDNSNNDWEGTIV
ncbi:ribbon-helix-helix domain-containing protein [Leuconostoc gelidum subsp. gasicomitatum]|uniref:ribbon-helix-helix domain-containing protein n=1 Tax=Leuconostoc gasicomitatum TaxID=115778 RepID=UPI001CC3332E|nr:ribbon-helix-helix domain-containing protein [Leuconostoc gasicomitatum]MBZ5993212.1 ribbon-helix-helix domain-containing protein [Leuconostoc gasicomitatum]